MCGRFALYASDEEIKETFNVVQLPLISKRYNIAPGQDALCIKNNNGSKEAVIMHWGLIPIWAQNSSISRHLINARAETIETKPAFRNAFKTHRGLIIMSGFYEWKRENGKKQPFYFKHPDDKPVAVAAIWDAWQNGDGTLVQSCCLVTTDANQLMRPVHDRMPVLLNKSQQAIWLNHDSFDKTALKDILMPCSENELIRYPVTIKMNNARFEDELAVKPF